MDVALSKNGARLLRVFFTLVVVFLYASIAFLWTFAFNESAVPTRPLSGYTPRWHRDSRGTSEIKAAREPSAIAAEVSRAGVGVSGVLAWRAWTRRFFRGKAAV